MSESSAWFEQRSLAWVALAAMLGCAVPLRGQVAADQEAADHIAASQELASPSLADPDLAIPQATNRGLAGDWSHRHLIFSHLGTADEALRNGTYDRWLKITGEPRYAMQQLRRSGAGTAMRSGIELTHPEAERDQDAETGDADEERGFENSVEPATPANDEDSADGVVPRGMVRALIPPQAQRRKSGAEFQSRDDRKNEGRKAGRKRENQLTRDWSETEGSGGTTGMGHFPATFTSNAASCTADFAVYNTSLAGSASQANVVAFNELYTGCTPRPSTYWAFDTGGIAATSVALSPDGTQVAFVQTDNVTGHADLVVLKWAAGGTLTGPKVLTSNSAYPTCTAPCMISIPFSGAVSDTNSSPYVDFGSKTAYVGDDSGQMHKFTNVFSSGTPAEAGSGWPVTLNTSTDAALSSPVYDSASGNIFVSDYLINIASNCEPGVKTTEGLCGYLYAVNSTTQAVTKSAQLDYNLGILDSPIVDSAAGRVYTWAGADHSTNCSSGPCAAVFQFPVNFAANAAGTEATVGAGYEVLLSGAFDNQYFTSGDPPSGHLYVVGGTGPQNNTLYAITISNNAMTTGSATAGPVVAANYTNFYYATGLQITEFCNNGNSACPAGAGTDYLFLSVLAFGSQFTTNPCPGQVLLVGCVMGFTAPNTSGVVSGTAVPNGTLQEAGGTSGIVVDNGSGGASNIYFTTLLNQGCITSGGTGGCAISATQAGLQ